METTEASLSAAMRSNFAFSRVNSALYPLCDAMPENSFIALFLVGLLGGTHCIGMCGGIVGALSLGKGGRPSLHLAYNGGRILSYACAGALAGAVGVVGVALSGPLPLRIVLFALANLMLIALGFYLMGATRTLAFAERFGHVLWRRIQPLTRRFLPARTMAQAFPLGLLWGWLPCGLVYSALVTALTSGSAWRGAVLMLAFGAGTLPTLLLAGLLATRLNEVLSRPVVRTVSGLVVLSFGLWGCYGVMRAVFPH
jgi:sulfite exporter TauE/SafE